MQIKAAANGVASDARLSVGGLHPRPVLPPVCPIGFAASGGSSAWNRLDSPSGRQVASSRTVVLRRPTIGDEHLVHPLRNWSAVFDALIFWHLKTWKSCRCLEATGAIPCQLLPIKLHIWYHKRSLQFSKVASIEFLGSHGLMPSRFISFIWIRDRGSLMRLLPRRQVGGNVFLRHAVTILYTNSLQSHSGIPDCHG